MDKPTAPLSAEARVKAKWPDAWAKPCLGLNISWEIWPKAFIDSNYPMWSLAWGHDTEAEAWSDAASRIEAQEKE